MTIEEMSLEELLNLLPYQVVENGKNYPLCITKTPPYTEWSLWYGGEGFGGDTAYYDEQESLRDVLLSVLSDLIKDGHISLTNLLQ